MIVAVTERLTVRFLKTGDAPFILDLLNERGFIDNIGDRQVRTLADAEAYIDRAALASYATHGHGLNLVERTTDREPLGMCGLLKRETLDHPDIGYALLERHWGHGYAREAAAAVLAHGRDRLNYRRIVAITAPHNATSGRLLESIGLRFEKIIRLEGQNWDNNFYSIDFD